MITNFLLSQYQLIEKMKNRQKIDRKRSSKEKTKILEVIPFEFSVRRKKGFISFANRRSL